MIFHEVGAWCALQVPEGAGVKDWDVHHRAAAPMGAPALQRFGGSGIRAKGDAAAALLSHFGPSAEAPDEVRVDLHVTPALRCCWTCESGSGVLFHKLTCSRS